MSEKTESEEFEDEEEADEDAGDGDTRLNLEELIEDLEPRKRGAVNVDEPAWRKLERYLEDKRTAEQVSDFDDYEIFDGDGDPMRRRRRRAG
jgi:hypothetical protein